MNHEAEVLAAPSWSAGLGKRIAKNTAWLLAGRLGSQGLALLFTILIARRLGEAGLGQYAYVTSILLVSNLTTTFGTDMLIMREVAVKRDLSVVPVSLNLQLGLACLFIAVTLLFARVIPNQSSQEAAALEIASLALIPMAFYSVFSATLRGLERMDVFTWLNLLNGALLVGFGWVFVQAQSSIVDIAWLLVAVNTANAAAAAFAYLRRAPWEGMKASKAQLKTLANAAAPIALLAIVGSLYQRAGIFGLTALSGAAATGTFSAALRVTEAAKIGHFALLGALFPAMAQAETKPDAKAAKTLSGALAGLLTFALVIAVLLTVFADEVTTLLFGSEFLEATGQLRVLAWLLAPVTITHFYSLRLLAAKQERAILVSLTASLLFSVIAILVCMPAWGAISVSFALVAAETLQAAMLLFFWKIRTRNVDTKLPR